jgi:hypothetical protein
MVLGSLGTQLTPGTTPVRGQRREQVDSEMYPQS